MDKAINLYPNPAKNDFQITLDKSINSSEIKNISIYNLYGGNVFETNKYTEKISLNGISSGVYLVKITVGNYQLIKKLIIQ
jgi:PKD repeat protein